MGLHQIFISALLIIKYQAIQDIWQFSLNIQQACTQVQIMFTNIPQ